MEYDVKDLITLTQTPAVPLNGDVVVEVILNRSDIQMVKFAKGELTAEYFENAGTEITKDENGKYTFTVREKDWYTVYAKVNSKSFAVKKIDVEDVKFDVSGLISLSQSPASNIPTNGEVTITALLSRSDVQTVKWASGIYTIEDFATIRSTEITADDNGKYNFVVEENGKYTVYAQCNSKSKAVNVIEITNIDKVAPEAPTNLAANYIHSSKTINIACGNPADADFDYALLNVKNGTTAIIDGVHVKSNAYDISEYTADNVTTVYVSVKAVDKAGNVSSETTYSFIPKAIPEVQSIILDRYHLSNTDENRVINATAYISNMNELSADDTIKIQIINKTSGESELNKKADLDKVAGTAKISFNAPNGNGEYTVRVKIGSNSADSIHTARFVISDAAEITSVKDESGKTELRKNIKDISSNSIINLKITGTNLDLGPVYVYFKKDSKLYGNNIEVDTSALKWTASAGDTKSKTLNISVPYPQEEGEYDLRVKGSNDQYHLSLWIYGDPEFTEFTVPRVDKSKEDIFVNCLIVGKNFMIDEFDVDDVEISCANSNIVDDYNVKVLNDSVLMVKVMAPGVIGDYEITARYKAESIKQYLKVRDYSSYVPGSVVLKDKTIVSSEVAKKYTWKEEENVVGYIGGFDYYGVPFILGKYTSDIDYKINKDRKKYAWKSSYIYIKEYKSSGMNVTFNNNTDVNEQFLLSEITSISGDGINSYNNSRIIESLTYDLENDFPAFYFCKNYGSIFSFEGEFESGWVVPSIVELIELAKNEEAINEVLITDFNIRGNKISMKSLNVFDSKSSSLPPNEGNTFGTSKWNIYDFNGKYKIGSIGQDDEYSDASVFVIKQIWED